MKTLVLANQQHIAEGQLNEKYLVPVFDALINGEEFWIDSKEFTGINLANETTKQVEEPKKSTPTNTDKLSELIRMIEKQCTVNGYLAVELDNLHDIDYDDNWTHFDTLFNRLAFEYDTHLNGGYGAEMVDEGILTEKQSERYTTKIKTFIVKYAAKYCNSDHAEKLVKEFK